MLDDPRIGEVATISGEWHAVEGRVGADMVVLLAATHAVTFGTGIGGVASAPSGMSRVALLPAGGDPFLNAYWLRHYARVWADEVDELVVYACSVKPEAVAYTRAIVAAAPHARILFEPLRADHGAMLGRLMDATDQEYVLLMEDDAFVRRPGVVDAAFRRIESGEVDIVGTARGCASAELIAAAEERWGPLVSTETGETGLSLYPCCYFGRRADLLATDRNYAARGWHAGENVPGLDLTAEEGWGADTFTTTTWQLRKAGLRIDSRAAYRTDLARIRGWMNAPWFHVGSLSSGYGCSFLGEMANYAGYAAGIAGEIDPYDWTKRVSWWQRAWECWDGALPDHHAAYGEALERFVADIGIRSNDVATWRYAFDQLISWDERP